jgi:para-nitrobenzyl esterase
LATCLRSKSTAEILATDSWAFQAGLATGGSLLPIPPADAVAAGRFARVPIVYGVTENELRNGVANFFPMSQADYEANLTQFFGSQVDAVKSLYPSAAYPDPFYAFVDAIDDSGVLGAGSCLGLEEASTFARYVPTYFYEFDDATAPNPSWVTAAPGFVSGASHGSDEQYWFDRPSFTVMPLNDAQRELAAEMVQDLGAFARGTPGALRSSRWPRFDPIRQRILRYRIGATGVSTTFAAENNCARWRSLGFAQ